MAKELYIYSPLYDFTAETVVKQLNEVSEEDELTFRLNTPGGNVTAGWAIISKLSERKAKTNAVIDGDAASMGALMLVFFDHVIANDTSTIMFHKAAYPTRYEPTDAELTKLKSINKIFKEKLTAKVKDKPGSKEFLDKIFEADIRNDVELTPQKAKSLGIVDEVRKLEPKAYSFDSQIVALAEIKSENKPPKSGELNNNLKIESMDLTKLKLEHPALYAQVFDSGKDAGVKQEKARAEAWAVFNEVDPEKVKAGIESGEPLSAKAMGEFTLQAGANARLEAIEKENNPDTDTSKDKKTKEELRAEADNKALDDELGEINSEKE